MKRYSSINPHGNIIVNDITIADTLQCGHCGRHWRISPGSNKVRGFCHRCGRVTCGNKECDPCLPQEER